MNTVMAKNEKTAAEKYREERKERIAKANKKNAKNIAMSKRAAGLGAKIIAILLACAIVVGLGAWCVRVTGIVDKAATALKVGDTRVSAGEYYYYYSNAYQQTAYYNQMYSQYGMNMGFDESLAPDDPNNTTTDEEGNTITWAEAFKNTASESAQHIIAFYTEAKKEGFELNEDQKAEMEETIDSYKENAESNHFSLSAYLKATFGASFNEKMFRRMLEMQEVADAFKTKKQEDFKAAVDSAEVEKKYKENTKDYDYVDVDYYTFNNEVLTADEGETDEALAKRQEASNKKFFEKTSKVFDKVTDLKSFNAAVKEYNEADKDAADPVTSTKHGSYSTLSSSLTEKIADWVYDSARKAGDKKYFEEGNSAYIVIVSKPAYTGHSVDVRHCLISFNAEDENNVTDEEKALAKEDAEKLLDEWKKGEATEESFAQMATDNTEDTGSAESGGLYAGMRITDSYVEEFLDWSFDPARKVGDTGIIETQYGYHIMYFAKDNKDDLDWENTIRTNMGEDAFTEYQDKLVAEDGDYQITEKAFWVDREANKFCKKIRRNLKASSK